MRPRIGVYGGTFDPIHNGHLRVAAAVREAFDLSRVLFVPALVPPHKRGHAISAAYHRYAMVTLATQDSAEMMASVIELEAPSKPYTVETLRRLEAACPTAQLFFVMGADSFADVTSWHEYEQLLSEYEIIVAARPGACEGAALTAHLAPRLQAQVVDLRGGHHPSEAPLTGPHVYLTDYVMADVAATDIRAAIDEGRAFDHLVPRAVARYIEKYDLYRTAPRL